MTPSERRRSARPLAVAAVGAGVLLAAASRALFPAAPPLYDGVIVNEPYRWLEPPPGARGGAQGKSGTAALEGGASPLVAIATPEQPPQAQVFAPPGALRLPAGTTSMAMSITPIPAEGAPSDGHIAGNVYRISITNQAGAPLTAPADAYVSLVMRGPESVLDATIERYVNGQWQPLDTSHAGYTSGFLAIVTEFGDFTLVAPNAPLSPTVTPSPAPISTAVPSGGTGGPGGSAGIDPVIIVGLAAAGIVLTAAAVYVYRRGEPEPPSRRRRGRKRRR